MQMNGSMLTSQIALFYFPLSLRTQLHKAGKRSQHEDVPGTYAHKIFDRLLIDLSYNSSRLEGNTYSLLDTQRLVLEGTGAEGKLSEEKVMILNHKEAIHYLIDHAHDLKVTRKRNNLHFALPSFGWAHRCQVCGKSKRSRGSRRGLYLYSI